MSSLAPFTADQERAEKANAADPTAADFKKLRRSTDVLLDDCELIAEYRHLVSCYQLTNILRLKIESWNGVNWTIYLEE